MLYRYQGQIAVTGTFKGVAGECAACGWAVLQLDAGGGDMPRYIDCGTVLVYN